MKKLDYGIYFDKVLGGWIGKSLGGTIGCFEGTKEVTDFSLSDLLPEELMANDDLDIQLVWMDALLNKGIYVTSGQLMDTWLREYDVHMGEYGYGKRNYNRGIKAPISGIYGNSFYKTGMGCPIRSEIWGMICPGNPGLASEYAYNDGILDHEGESVWAEQFLATMEAEAFFESDLPALINSAMKIIPVNSRLYKCICDAVKGFKQGLPWEKTWELLRNGHSHPDCTYAPFNLGIIVMALLYGGGNFEKTMLITANSGWDVDCTCATSGAVLGIINGKRGFSQNWLDYIGDKVVAGASPEYEMTSLRQLAEYTCRAGVTIMREGLSQVDIENIPASIESIPAIKYTGEISFNVDYNGYPAIGKDETKNISVYVFNHGNRAITGVLTLDIPEDWEINKSAIPITIEAGRQINIDYMICAARVKQLNDKNIIKACFNETAGFYWEYSFGLCGTPVCKVLGPFFDSYKDWLSKEALALASFKKSGDKLVPIANGSEEWCNHRIDIDKEYVKEDFTDSQKTAEMFSNGASVNIYDDIYAIKDVYGMQGPCCVYYYQEIRCPSAQKALLNIGSTDPYKIWMNGKLLYTQNNNRFWLPINDAIVVGLREGVNQFIIKTARCGSDNRLSSVFREYNKNILPKYDVTPFVVDLSYGVI